MKNNTTPSKNQFSTKTKNFGYLPDKITYFLPKEEFLVITRKKNNLGNKLLLNLCEKK